MIRIRRLLLVNPALVIVSAVASAILIPKPARADDQFEPVRQRINKGLVDHNLPSISVAVARDGKIIWEQGFGWADRENRVGATEHTLYSIASTSKPITATGLMVLKERKVVELDRPAPSPDITIGSGANELSTGRGAAMAVDFGSVIDRTGPNPTDSKQR